MTMFLRSSPPAAMIRITEMRIRAQFGDAGWDRLLSCYRDTARADEGPYEALLSDAMWHRPMEELAQLQDKAGGRVWLSRFDHAPQLEPFRSQGPTHGADNACLWAHLPAFIDRPVLQRAGGPMTLADIEAAARLQACVLRFAHTGRPDDAALWPTYTAGSRQLAIFDSPFRISSLNNTSRDRTWRLMEDKRDS
jgi:para-nitrobenzyl esterase